MLLSNYKNSSIKMSVFPEFTVPARVLRAGISPLVLPSRVVRGVRPGYFETEEQLEMYNKDDGYGLIRKSAIEDSCMWLKENRSRLDVGKYTMDILHKIPDEWEVSLKCELIRVNSIYWEYVLSNHVEIAHYEHETSVLKKHAYENRISLLKKKSYDFESGVSNFGEIFKKKDEITKLRELYLQP